MSEPPEALSLLRAVSPAELDDINEFGGFRQAPSGLSYEAKLFAVSAEDALAWGRSLYRTDESFVIVAARIPLVMARRLYNGLMDGRPVVAVYPELLARVQ